MESASLQVLLLANGSFIYHTHTQMQMLFLADVNLIYYTHAESDVWALILLLSASVYWVIFGIVIGLVACLFYITHWCPG